MLGPQRDRAFPHRAVYAAMAAAAFAVLPAGAMPAFTMWAWIGPDAASHFQRVRTYTLLEYGHPRYVAFLLLVGVMVVACGHGLIRPGSWIPLPLVVLAGLVCLALLNHYQLSEGSESVYDPFLSPAYDAVARLYGTTQHDLYGRTNAGPGWYLTLMVVAVVTVVAAVALGWRLSQRAWIPVVAGIVVVVLAGIPEDYDATREDYVINPHPMTNPLGAFVVYAALALAVVGIGRLCNRRSPDRWPEGVAAIAIGLVCAGLARLALET